MARKTTAKQFEKELAQIAQAIREKIERDVEGFDSSPSAVASRKALAHGSLEFFARTYFPHYVKKDNSLLHDYLYSRLVEIADSGQSETDAIAAPRGEAKSTITSQIYVMWCVVTGRKHYPIIGMDAFDQAAIMLEAIKAELEFNPRLLCDFPAATGQGKVWQAGVIVTQGGAKIEAVGTGKRIRGRRHGPYRPDLFIGDDLENDENVKTPEQRDKLQGWLTKAVLNLGGAGEKFDTIIIGTVLHYDSVLARLLRNKLWRGMKFKAMLRWPDAMHLWDEWEEKLLNDGPEPAARFYAANQIEMDAGAEVSWPAGRPLVELMKIRARDGHSAFDSELQNDPLSAEDAPFAGCIHFWVNRLADWVMYGACDPSMGKTARRNDPSAILVGGFNREKGILNVVEAAIGKRKPDRIIMDVIAMQKEYRCLVWAVEIVQFQEFFKDELVRRSAQLGVPVPAKGFRRSSDKDLDIESLQPHCANKLILFQPRLAALIEMLTHWPKADHDDGPDALYMLWKAAQTGNQRTYQSLRMRGI